MKLSVIVAVAENHVIGREGALPWHLRADLQRFKRITIGHHLIMGRSTYESIGRLLPGRTTIILSRQDGYAVEGALVASSLADACQLASQDSEAFVVGGSSVYAAALPLAERLYLTRVLAHVDGDVHLPELDLQQWQLLESELQEADEQNDHACRFEIHQRCSR